MVSIRTVTINENPRETTEIRGLDIGTADLSGIENYLASYYPRWTSAVIVIVPRKAS